MAGRKVYCSRGNLLFAVVIWTFALVILLANALATDRPHAWILLAAGTGPAAIGGLFASRVGVHVAADGVRVVKLFGTTRLRWDEIERFELAPAGVYPYARHAILKSGRDIAILGITVPRFFTERLKRFAREPIDELNALLRAAASPATDDQSAAPA